MFSCHDKPKIQKQEIKSIPKNKDIVPTKMDDSVKIFTLRNSSERYDAVIHVGYCDNSYCKGKGKVEVFEKSTNELVQIFTSEDLFTELDKFKKPTERIHKKYDGQSVIFFDDFNFDSNEDLAIRNGNMSSYHGPSYDIYLSNGKKFVIDSTLTDLVSYNLGMFRIDKKRKRITTYGKSGCCWHIMTEYKYDKKPIKVYEFEETNTAAGDSVKIIERTLVGKKWKIKTYLKPYRD